MSEPLNPSKPVKGQAVSVLIDSKPTDAVYIGPDTTRGFHWVQNLATGYPLLVHRDNFSPRLDESEPATPSL